MVVASVYYDSKEIETEIEYEERMEYVIVEISYIWLQKIIRFDDFLCHCTISNQRNIYYVM